METTVRRLIEESGRPLAQTAYHSCSPEILDFRLVSPKMFQWEQTGAPEQQRLLFKDVAAVTDFAGLTEEMPELRALAYKKREQLPYLIAGLERFRAAMAAGEPVSIEGGPCLFGEHEVTGEVRLRGGRVFQFDYSTGKRYTDDASGAYDLSDPPDETDLGSFLHTHAAETEQVSFRTDKTGLTKQEYLHVLMPFAVAAALNVPLVLTLPDMSYRKYLEYAVLPLPEEMAARIMAEFDAILYGISDLYLDLAERLQAHFQIPKLAIVHNRDPELVRLFETARKPYIERNKVLRHLTSFPAKLEPIKDYISMPALPLYLWGAKAILEVNSMDETDSFRKCRRAHRNAFESSCILFPELLSADGENTLYCAPLAYKDYRDYTSAQELDDL